MKRFIATIALTMMVLTGCVKNPVPCADQRPSCPTEDSCTADYHDGAWFVGGVRVSR